MKMLVPIIYLLLFVRFNSMSQEDKRIYTGTFDIKDGSLFDNIVNPDKIDSQRYHGRVYLEGVFSKKQFQNLEDFYYNRCKIYLRDSVFDKPLPPDDFVIAWRPFCKCNILNDTLFVIMSDGIMMDSYTGLLIRIYNNTFNFQYSSFYEPGSWGVRFLNSESDSIYTSGLVPAIKYQYLLLKNKPFFKPNHQITGYLAFTTYAYSEKSIYGIIDRHNISGRLFFTCKTKLMTPKKSKQ